MEPATERKALGQVIRTLRELDDLSRDELAEKSKLGPDMIAKIEQGVKSPSASALNRIAAALGISAVDLSTRGLAWATAKDSPEASTALLRAIAAGSAVATSFARTSAGSAAVRAAVTAAGVAGAYYVTEHQNRRVAEESLRALLEQRLRAASSVDELEALAQALDPRDA